jgi:diacylglycerol kinase (ATP)
MSSPFGTLDVIVDPGNRSLGEGIPSLQGALEGLGLAHRLHLAEPGGEEALAREVRLAGGRFLVAVGDDGAVRRVINGCMRPDGPATEDLVLGVVPAGSGNDLVRSFGLPDDTAGACAHLTGDNVYPLDLMEVRAIGDDGAPLTTFAANLAEVGMGGEMARRMAATGRGSGGRREPFGKRRFLAFWAAYARTRPASVTIRVDTRSWEGRAFNVVIGNGQFTGGLRLAPRSFPGDGVLDALVFHGPRSDAYTMLPDIYRHGDHVPSPRIAELRAKIRIAIEADRPMPVVADGVPSGTTPATFQVVPHAMLLKL